MNALTHILRAIKAALFALLCLAAVPANAHERKQFREHQRMRATGQRVEVVGTFEQVDALLP